MSKIKNITDEVIMFISEYQGIPLNEIKEDSNLVTDLGISSFDLFEMINAIEAQFDVSVENIDFGKIEVVSDISKFVCEK